MTPRYRVGIGYDIHRLKKGRKLIIGGVEIPHSLGLDGHSDADVLLHAIIDALLGAAGLSDIGHYFPPGDPKTKGISSGEMLSRAMFEVVRAGYQVVNVDSVIVAEEPKIGPYREQIRTSAAALLQIDSIDVQVKGKTNEQLDAIGAKKAIAAQAVVLLCSKSTTP